MKNPNFTFVKHNTSFPELILFRETDMISVLPISYDRESTYALCPCPRCLPTPLGGLRGHFAALGQVVMSPILTYGFARWILSDLPVGRLSGSIPDCFYEKPVSHRTSYTISWCFFHSMRVRVRFVTYVIMKYAFHDAIGRLHIIVSMLLGLFE